MTNQVNWLTAAIAGVVSFLSPCVLLLGIGGLIMTDRLGWLAQYLTFFNRFTW